MEAILPFNNISVRPLHADGSSGDPRADLSIEIKEEGQAFILRITDGKLLTHYGKVIIDLSTPMREYYQSPFITLTFIP